MRLNVSRDELEQLAQGWVPEGTREKARKLLDPTPAMIEGQTDLEEMLGGHNSSSVGRGATLPANE